ncbi:L-2-hydroxyglutarate dehydrogenase, mitochondrial [Monomorium pharaonis]|uniref:L-2-hydroxyglutarate dehydrogenase, mitochondrial n=1 Tax=Monomorium pharaonis TaxID=307658 RepID=UPI00063EFCE2|nr:L-2-hydroxyglutarate dehydrogenase, mitochondrial [Monomorium pharaonis]XP_012530194.1 L-2-hydroxyglutarate dehydrogenase, mitochondrial [Monomorium pharaonis]XP_012530195.1 L-2-hydroxyglutarate dehydrogenase, mitochondrial [Monomorium pharaonis]XP_036150284.1 L-2-hydroxyglutarate dehydrogenase, mitochondrial-like [Monomorium pharaonis]XP_036150285.1 L-2-hydroxyglutarate dehydrogenase, mitochondrial-like [Monomorium pharaonis]XP_036150287.1 L-2-hydroxyglutarate dehydrogenase, mitochondrial-
MMRTSVITSLIGRAALRPNYLSRHQASTSTCTPYDLVIVGGGIVGCATAREMMMRHPNMKMAIVEKENDLARHQTGHNSGVVHAGIYYTPGSMKAKLCVEGLKLSYEYFCKNNIPHKKVGKLIVAQNPAQIKRIDDLFDRGTKNKVPDLQIVEKDCISKYEPKCQGEKAIWSPWTGIVDWAVVCKSFAEDFRKMGGEIFLNFEVTGFTEIVESKGKSQLVPISVHSKNRCIPTKYVLTCAGLHSDRLAVMTGCDLSPRIVPFRGEYLLLSDSKKHLCTTNVYPVPDPRFPFLGVHFTPRVNGDIWLGPNAVLAFAREGYSWFDINVRDCIEMAKFPGLYKLCFRYFVPGCMEMIKSIFYQLAVKDLQKFIPEVTYQDVKRGPAGVRAQAMDRDGKLVDDFVFDTGTGTIGSRVLHCRNAPSPAATSSMAIAKFIADKLDRDFKF